MTKTEFVFKLSNQIHFHKGGDVVYIDKIILKAPSAKNRHYTTRLRQTFTQAIKDMTQTETSNKSSTEKPQAKTNIDGISVIAFLMMSKIDLNICYDDFKEILLNGCAFVDKDAPFNELLYEQLVDDDLELMLGEYIANFLIPSWTKQMMKP